jgi:hypothetical protein
VINHDPLVGTALAQRRPGPYQLQAAIAPATDLDDELRGWLATAYTRAG